MAQIRPKPARPPSSRPPAMRRRSQRRKRRIGSSVAKVGPPLSILDEPSPTIEGTSTTENAMLFWVGWFARFHLAPEGPRYVPHQIRTLDCPVCRPDGTPVLHADGQPLMMLLHPRSGACSHRRSSPLDGPPLAHRPAGRLDTKIRHSRRCACRVQRHAGTCCPPVADLHPTTIFAADKRDLLRTFVAKTTHRG